jgi:uncharacterized membrane protein
MVRGVRHHGRMAGYRTHPDAVRDLLAAVDRVPFDRDDLWKAFRAASDSIRSTDDGDADDVITALSSLEGDLRDAPARIDSRIAAVRDAAARVLDAVETGDTDMSSSISAQHADVGGYRSERFGAR